MGNQNGGCCAEDEAQDTKSLDTLNDILEYGLFQTKPKLASIDKRSLSMVYSPGVGAACKAIEENPSRVDDLTMRKQSVAVVSNGTFFRNSVEKIQPALNWYAAQIKFYSGLNAYPFALRKESRGRIPQFLKDLSNNFGTILYLDDHRIGTNDIPTNTLVVKQPDIIDMCGSGKVDAEVSAKVISYLQAINFTGLAPIKQMEKGMNYKNWKLNKSRILSEFDEEKDLDANSLDLHEKLGGKIGIELNFSDINAVKPHFSEKKLKALSKVDDQNRRKFKKLCAVVTDGSAVMDMGSISPSAAVPVVEGKALIFKLMGDVDVVPVCIDKRENVEDTVEAILDLAGEFQAVNLEGFKSPESLEIAEKLIYKNKMPIFQDNQHGIAIIVLAGLINALKVTGKQFKSIKVVINGAGVAGKTIANLLLQYGIENIIVCDRKGAIFKEREDFNDFKKEIAECTNSKNIKGELEKVIDKADVFIGVSSADSFKKEWIKKMNPKSIIFALANPNPEISEKDAIDGGAEIYASGRSDQKNQISNNLVFPGVFRAISEHNLREITDQMKLTVAKIIADSVHKEYLSKDNILPDSLDTDIPIRISKYFRT